MTRHLPARPVRRAVLDPETGIEEPVTTDARGRIPDSEFVEPPLMPGAASPDERLREALRDANEYLAQIADYSPSEVADAIDSVRAQIKDALAATDSRGKPDGASVPDQSCAACGGSGDRNGNRRAADPFGTCPGCDGTGKASRRIVVYDARAGRAGLTVPVGCTVGEAAWLAVAAMRVRVSPNDRPTLALRGAGLHASDPLPDDLDYELFVIGGTV